MMWFRTCLRCGGDLYQNEDLYGLYVACIQCGRYLSDAEIHLLHAIGTLALEPESVELAAD